MKEIQNRIVSSIVLLSILYCAIISEIILSIVLFIIVFILFSEFHNMYLKIFKKNKLLNLIIVFITLFYLAFFSLYVWFFLNFENEGNKILLFFILSICISTDIGGYVFGKTFKGVKLTKISPNKTYSGMLGSFILSLIVSTIFFKELNLSNLLVITFLISFTSQIGDLLVSYLKRKAKIKDSGSFIPGHGGLLDRMDGILFALPLGILLVSY